MKFEHDLTYVRLAIPDLEEFLLSKEIFWPLPSAPTQIGQPGLEQLSLGLLRLSVARLQAEPENEEATQLAAQMVDVRGRWRSNWSKKAALEYSSRLRMWKDRLEELLRDPSLAYYRYEVRLRVILALLADDLLAGIPLQEQEYLAGLDARLKGASVKAGFIWDPAQQAGFPEETHWYLYRELKSPQGVLNG